MTLTEAYAKADQMELDHPGQSFEAYHWRTENGEKLYQVRRFRNRWHEEETAYRVGSLRVGFDVEWGR